MVCPKFYESRRRFHTGHLLDKVEGGVGVRVSEFDNLVVVVLHTLNRRRIAVFDEIGCFSRGGVHFLVSFFGLRGALFRHLAECLLGVRLWDAGEFWSCGLGVLIHEVLFLWASTVEDFLTRRPERWFNILGSQFAERSGAPTRSHLDIGY